MKALLPIASSGVFVFASLLAGGHLPVVHLTTSTALAGETRQTRQNTETRREAGIHGLNKFELMQAVNEGDISFRLSAIEALVQMGADAKPGAMPLQLALKDENADIRAAAVRALAIVDAEASVVVPLLKYDLRDERAYVRQTVVDALSQYGPEAKEAVPDLIVLLWDEDERVRRSAIEALAEISPNVSVALPALVKVMKGDDVYSRVCAAKAIARMDKAAAVVPVLVEALGASDEIVRHAAIETLAEISENASEALPALRKALESDDAYTRVVAAKAIARTGETATTIPVLVQALGDDNEIVRRSAIEALGEIGPNASAARPLLLRSVDTNVGNAAVRALTEISPESGTVEWFLERLRRDKDADASIFDARALIMLDAADKAVPFLIEALKDELVGYRAADALGEAGSAAISAAPALGKMLEQAGEQTTEYFAAIRALGFIAESMQDKMTSMSVGELEDAISILTPLESIPLSHAYAAPPAVPQIGRCLNALRAELARRRQLDFRQSVQSTGHDIAGHRWLWVPLGIVTYIGVVILLWLIMLRCCPLQIVKFHEVLAIPSTLNIKWLGCEVSCGPLLRHVLLLDLFVHRIRVLDSWVHEHLDTARLNFAKIPSVEQRQIHIPIPALVENLLRTDITSQALRESFRKRLFRVLIRGEGGIGKTSFAFQLCKWAMDAQESKRLTPHVMLPVLLEQDIGNTSLLDAARGQLRELIEGQLPIPESFFLALVRRQRVLLVVDHLSEMSTELHDQIELSAPEFPFSALIVTSRVPEDRLSNAVTIRPIRLERERVTFFLTTYLSQLGKLELFRDQEIHQSCADLTRLAGDRDITPLLARLYVDQVAKAKESTSASCLPKNIPALMLRYLDELHSGADSEMQRQTQEDAKVVARQCLKDSFLPSAAPRDEILRELGGEDAAERLGYLESTLHVIQTVGIRHDHMRFLLDPLAEYLAALKLAEMYKGNTRHWNKFLVSAKEKDVERVRGFLLAVRDCCIASQCSVPRTVIEELEKLGGIDGETRK